MTGHCSRNRELSTGGQWEVIPLKETAGVLADVCGKSLSLSGTLMGGCARRYLAV